MSWKMFLKDPIFTCLPELLLPSWGQQISLSLLSPHTFSLTCEMIDLFFTTSEVSLALVSCSMMGEQVLIDIHSSPIEQEDMESGARAEPGNKTIKNHPLAYPLGRVKLKRLAEWIHKLSYWMNGKCRVRYLLQVWPVFSDLSSSCSVLADMAVDMTVALAALAGGQSKDRRKITGSGWLDLVMGSTDCIDNMHWSVDLSRTEDREDCK